MASKKLAAKEQGGPEQSAETESEQDGIAGPADAAMAHGNAAMQAFVDEEQALDAGSGNEILLAVARTGIIAEFQNVFLPSEAFQQAFQAATSECNETLAWEEVSTDVLADAEAFGAGEYDEVFEEEDEVTFAGRVWGLYTEATVGRDGAIKKLYFEID
jgi:hypothetical protein